MNKSLIQQRFQKNLNTYNENAVVQKEMAKKLISMLDEEKKFSKILEIGCGTGILTELINQKLEFESFIANDIVEDCKNYIKEINPQISFTSGDIEECIKTTDKKFDLIISNATFQWVRDLENFIKILVSKLNPNGILLFSTFGEKNFKEIYETTGKTLSYYSKPQIEKMVQYWENSVEEEIQVLEFESPKEVLKHLKNTGVNSLEITTWTKSNMNNFEKIYNSICSNSPKLTYHPIFIKIIRYCVV